MVKAEFQRLRYPILCIKMLVFFCALFGVAPLAYAQTDTEAYVRIEPEEGSTDTVFKFEVTAKNADVESPPTLGTSSDFNVQYRGPISRVQILNGEVTREMSWIYALSPLKEGDLKTPEVSLRLAGKSYPLEQINVKVRRSIGGPAGTNSAKGADSIKGVVLRQQLSSHEAFVGEQVALDVDLLTTINLYEPQFPDLVYNGFLVKTITDNERGEEILEGTPYERLRFRRALFAIDTGEIELAARTIQARIRVKNPKRSSSFPFDALSPFGSDFFDQFVNGGPLKDIQISSNKLHFRAVPLPQDTQNNSGRFSGIVGETTVAAEIDKPNVRAGDSVNLRVTVTSTGNLSSLKKLGLRIHPQIQVYEEIPQTTEFQAGGLLVTRKVFVAALVPTLGGVFKLPAYQIRYFDPVRKEYRTAESETLEISVTGPSSVTPVATPNTELLPGQNEEKSEATSVLHYTEPNLIERLQKLISAQMIALGLAVSGLLIFVSTIVIKNHKKNRPKRNALHLCVAAQNFNEVQAAVKYFMEHTIGIDASLRGPQLRNALSEKQLPTETALLWVTLLDDLDSSLYGGNTSISSIEHIRDRALALMRIL